MFLVSHTVNNFVLEKSGVGLSDIADISQVIIAVINAGFAYYVFVYQKRYNLSNELKTSQQNEQNIKLQWFKELIVQPNISHLHSFFDNLETIKDKFDNDSLSEDKVLEINTFIKYEAKQFRKKFNDSILFIDEVMYKAIKSKVEDLVTKLTTVVSDDEFKLTNHKTVEREILEPINYAKNEIISIVFKYKGC